MTEERESLFIIWVTYVCSNTDCKDPGSPRDDKRSIEPNMWLKTEVIPEILQYPCPNCGGQLIRESLLKT